MSDITDVKKCHVLSISNREETKYMNVPNPKHLNFCNLSLSLTHTHTYGSCDCPSSWRRAALYPWWLWQWQQPKAEKRDTWACVSRANMCSCSACVLMNSAVRFHIIIQPSSLPLLLSFSPLNSCLVPPHPIPPPPSVKACFPTIVGAGPAAGLGWGAGWERPCRLDMSRCLRH